MNEASKKQNEQSVDWDVMKKKMEALDAPGAIITFDPDEAEELGCDEGVDEATWLDAVLASQDEIE